MSGKLIYGNDLDQFWIFTYTKHNLPQSRSLNALMIPPLLIKHWVSSSKPSSLTYFVTFTNNFCFKIAFKWLECLCVLL
jgi:hypothetical protein